MREIPLYFLLGHLLIAAVGSVCVPIQCLKCHVTDYFPLSITTAPCVNVTQSNCTKDFKVSVSSNGSGANAGGEITLTCDHNLPNLNPTFEWMKDKRKIEERRNGSKLVLKKLKLRDSGKYSCSVKSPCGTYKSPPHDVTVNAAVGSVCVPIQCLKCHVTDSCPPCIMTALCVNATQSNCIKDFKVSVSSNGSEANAGGEITLTCDHNLPNLNLTFEWMKDKRKIEERRNGSKLVLKKLKLRDSGKYSCSVKSPCGTYESLPHDVTVNDNSVVLLVICGVAALVLIVIMGMAMKFKLKRDNAKHKERMRQRAQAAQSSSPAPITPRDS